MPSEKSFVSVRLHGRATKRSDKTGCHRDKGGKEVKPVTNQGGQSRSALLGVG